MWYHHRFMQWPHTWPLVLTFFFLQHSISKTFCGFPAGLQELQDSYPDRMSRVFSPSAQRRSDPGLSPKTSSPGSPSSPPSSSYLPRWSNEAMDHLFYFVSANRPAVAKALQYGNEQRSTPFAVDVRWATWVIMGTFSSHPGRLCFGTVLFCFNKVVFSSLKLNLGTFHCFWW